MNEFIYDLRNVENELEARGINVPTKVTLINRIKKLRMYSQGKAMKTSNGFITNDGKKGSKWLLTEEGMEELIKEFTEEKNIEFDFTKELIKDLDKKQRLRKTENNSYLIEVDANLVNKLQNKGYRRKEDITGLINSLLKSHYQKIEIKEKEMEEARQKYEELQKELNTMTQKIKN